jgi:hypothetical protein
VFYLTENSCKKTNSDPEKILAGKGLKKAESRSLLASPLERIEVVLEKRIT